MRALGYFRVGKEGQASGERSPLLEQEQAFLRFCERHGYEPLSTFVDVKLDEKGSYPEFERLLDYLRGDGKGFLAVVVKNLGQLGSIPWEQARSLLQIEQLGARVVCMEQDIAEPMSEVLKAWSQKRQAEGRGEKVKEAMRLRAIRGEGLGKPAFGYRIGKDGHFEIMPEEAAIVQLIFRLYIHDNMGLRRIARYLNEQGITTRRGGHWSMVSIYDMLRNRTYVGTYMRFGLRVPGNHPPIISTETLRLAQNRLSSRSKPGSYAATTPFLLSGLVHCGYCGNRLIGVNRRQSWTRRRDGEQTQSQYRYYQCQSRTNQSICGYHTRRAEELEAAIFARLQEPASPRTESQAPSNHEEKASQQAALEVKVRALERRLRHHLDQAVSGAIGLHQLRSLHQEIEAERRSLEHKLALLSARVQEESSLTREKERFEGSLQRLRTGWESLSQDEKRELLKSVVDKVTVFDDRIELALRF